MEDVITDTAVEEAQVVDGLAEGAAQDEAAPQPGEPTPTIEEALAERDLALAETRAAMAQRDAELQGLRRQVDAAVARYREALLEASPEVPPDLVTGDTIEAVEASLRRARSGGGSGGAFALLVRRGLTRRGPYCLSQPPGVTPTRPAWRWRPPAPPWSE